MANPHYARNVATAGFAFGLLVCTTARLPGQTVIEPDGYTRWLLTIPAESKIRIKSDFGNFQVPVGYLTNRLFFRQNPTALNHGVARFDAGQEQSWPAFAFNFWVPDGGMVWHGQPQVRANRPIEPGHMQRTRESFVVKMYGAGSVHAPSRTTGRARLSPSPKELDVILPAQPVFRPEISSTAYEGATRDRVSDKLLRFYVHCTEAPMCEGWLVIDRRGLALWAFVPKDAVDFMLDAVKVAARLLDEWEEAARQKGP